VLLRMEPNAAKSGVEFGIEVDVPVAGGNNAQRRENDRRPGQGTMSRAGAWCPCCGKAGTVAMEMEDVRAEGLAGRLGLKMTAVVVDGADGKEYRPPTGYELAISSPGDQDVVSAFSPLPFGPPDEPLPGKEALGIRVPLYGLDTWRKLYTNRQLVPWIGDSY
jgi:putative DNA methylase